MRSRTAQPEVIQQWADMDSEGATYERRRLDANVQRICITEQAGVPDSLKDANKGVKVKTSDVSYLVGWPLLTQRCASL